MEWARESKQNLVILLLDFEKAYDRVNWSFLQQSMTKLGFCQTWIKWTSTLYKRGKTLVLVNGQKTEPFAMGRGVRQGCPVAPYLFLFAADILGYMIADQRYAIEGLKLPNGTVLRELLFADDTSLFLKGTKDNLDRVHRVLQLYCEASGARINWRKSKAIWASDATRNFEWGTELGLQWLPTG